MARALRCHAGKKSDPDSPKGELSVEIPGRAEQSQCGIGKLAAHYDGSLCSRWHGLDVLPRYDHFHRFRKSSDLNNYVIAETVGRILC
jgi:hypothetical protein